MEIMPFKPLMYSKDFSKVTSPPFDTITQEQERDLKENPYNVTYLTLPGPAGYGKVKEILQKWLDRKILVHSDEDVVIVLLQEFHLNNELKQRIGLISLVRIFPEDGSISPHERTFEKFVKERLDLMSELGCQLEPIFMAVPDNNFDRVLRRIISSRDFQSKFEEPSGVTNYLYIIKEEDVIQKLRDLLKSDRAIIADGHHRLRATRKMAENTFGEEREFWSYAMAYLTSIYDSGLQISGVHRMVKTSLNSADILQELGKYFTMGEHVSFEDPNNINLYDGRRFYSLIPKEGSLIQLQTTDGSSLIPAIVMSELILKKILKLTEKEIEEDVRFTHDITTVINSVDRKEASIAFLMPEWDKESFIALSMKNTVFPQKSTYFYPKIPSGIAINYFCR